MKGYNKHAIPLSARISPSGDKVAYRQTEYTSDEIVTDTYIADINDNQAPHRLTRAGGGWRLRWHPTNNQLGVITVRDDNQYRTGAGQLSSNRKTRTENTNDHFGQVWLFDLEKGGDPTQITFTPQGVSDFSWSPSGDKLVAVTGPPKNDKSIHSESNDSSVASTQVHRPNTESPTKPKRGLVIIDTTTGEMKRLDKALDYSDHYRDWYRRMSPKWGSNGRILYSATPKPASPDNVRDIFSIDPDTGEVRKHTDSSSTYLFPEWSPDGSRFSAMRYQGDRRYIPFDSIVGETEEAGNYTTVTGNLKGYPHYVDWLSNEDLVAVILQDGRSVLRRYEIGNSWMPYYKPEIDLRSVNYSGAERPFDIHVDSGRLASTILGPNHTSVRLITADGENDMILGEQNQYFTDSVGLECFTEEVHTDAGMIESLVYTPPVFEHSDKTTYPVIVESYRQPFSLQLPRFEYRNYFWTNRGYVVVKINHRGSQGYGREHAQSLADDYQSADISDTISVLNQLKSYEWVDDDQIYGIGYAFGASTIANIATETDLFAAFAAQHGIYDYESAFGLSELTQRWESLFDLPSEIDALTGRSIIQRSGSITSPTLLIGGENDQRSPPSQSKRLYSQLERGETPAKLIIYEDIGFTALGPPHVAQDRLQQISEWFNEFK